MKQSKLLQWIRFNKYPESSIIYILCAVQFVNILDFIMVMPMGPDFAKALGIPSSHLGWIGGSYTAASAIAGLIGSRFLDLYDRRIALSFAILGLAFSTLLAAFAFNFETLLFARLLAGAFGGPTTSLVLSIATDISPVERRGRALGAVFSSFSIASILGVPVGLELARLGGWRAPFIAVGLLAFLVNLIAFFKIPSQRAHLDERQKQSVKTSSWSVLTRLDAWLAFACIGFGMITAFTMIPNFSAYLQFNLGYPREGLGQLYFFGGLLSFILMGTSGWAVDKFGSTPLAWVSTFLLVLVLWFGYHEFPPQIPVMVMFVGFMGAMSIRGVATSTLTSKVPLPHERASFMSLQSATQNACSAFGAFLSTLILSQSSDGSLLNMPALSMFSIAASLMIPVCVMYLESRVVKGLQFKANRPKI